MKKKIGTIGFALYLGLFIGMVRADVGTTTEPRLTTWEDVALLALFMTTVFILGRLSKSDE